MSVMANGWGSREKARIALRRMQHVPKQDENQTAPSSAVQSDEESVDAKPLTISSDVQQFSGSKRSIVRLDIFLMFVDFDVVVSPFYITSHHYEFKLFN